MKKQKNKQLPVNHASVIQAIPEDFIFKYKAEEAPLFMAHGCVLVEIHSEGQFTYRAENFTTGKNIILGHRPNRLPEAYFHEIAERMGRCAAGSAWLSVDADDSALFSRKRLQEIMEVIFQRILPLHGFIPREKQLELAREILSSLCNLDISLAEAEVGTGKTLAYLIPAVIAWRSRINSRKINTRLPDGRQTPVVIATSSIALQRAIEQDYVPALSDILLKHGVIKTPLVCVLRKGKGHYLCERRFYHFLLYADKKIKKLLAPLEHGDFIDLAAARNLTPYIKRAICVDKHCNKDCPKYLACRYMRHISEAKRGGYDFQVCNHNYLLADVLRRTRGQSPLIPDYQAVIIDEAHKFLDAARSMYGCTLSFLDLSDVISKINEFTYHKGVPTADIRRKLPKIATKAGMLFQFLNKEVPFTDDEDEISERHPTKIRERAEKLIRSLVGHLDALADMLEERHAIVRYETEKKEAARTLNHIAQSLRMFIRHKELVYWLEAPDVEDAAGETPRDIPFPILQGIPKDLGKFLFNDLWNKKIPFVLTSGTLSAAGCFEHIKRKTGLDLLPDGWLTETTKPSPFNYKENALIYISENTPFPDNKNHAYIDAVTEETARLIDASNGHAAVLFTSYKAMDMVYERISVRNLPYPLFRLDRGGSAAIEQFKSSGNGVLFASGALWEGIDIPGDILSMLVIVRLPFAVPDPVSEWERTLYPNLKDYIVKIVVPEMLIKLKQGFGRLIRVETDTGVVAILDCRAGKLGAYRRRILAALPSCRVTSQINEVRQFLRDKKLPVFFINTTQG
ncbi:MAG: ATP-dependent DNA helicase [Clostridiales bacterium]|jgi:ATP-dependent DNA helicase DinG|nr:ATP-dependent DNA helicase [Clostridiales bacterium]